MLPVSGAMPLIWASHKAKALDMSDPVPQHGRPGQASLMSLESKPQEFGHSGQAPVQPASTSTPWQVC